jgi:hypothetical protein
LYIFSEEDSPEVSGLPPEKKNIKYRVYGTKSNSKQHAITKKEVALLSATS